MSRREAFAMQVKYAVRREKKERDGNHAACISHTGTAWSMLCGLAYVFPICLGLILKFAQELELYVNCIGLT